VPWVPSYEGEYPTLGWLALDWMTAYLARPETQEYEPLILTKEQAQFVLRFYELDPITCKRIIQRGVLSRPRGWGKSPITAALACLEGLGPTVPAGWDADGRPVGKPWSAIRKPLVEIAAVSEQQVDTNTWSPLKDMLSFGPATREYPGLDVLEGAIILPYGRIQKRTAAAGSAKGAPAHFVVCDQALALDTLIPTPDGWTTMGDLQDGEIIYGSQGPTRVVKAKPVSLDHDCYEVTFADGTSVVASAGHLWQTKIAESPAAPKIRTTQEMDEDIRRFRIPAAPAQEMAAANHSVPPYLLGLWLGDGTRGKCEIAVGEDDLEATQRALADVGVETWPRRYDMTSDGYGARPTVNLSFSRRLGYQGADRPEVAKALRALDCFESKHIPHEFFAGSIEERTQLVRGLMDSDGSASKTGSCVFVNTSHDLAVGLVRLLRSLGQVTTAPKWREDKRYTEGGKWLVHFTPRLDFQPFALPRKAARVRGHRRGPDWVTITSITPVERVPVRCIAVEADDHLFAFGVAGHLTHNTEEWTKGNGGINLYNKLKNNVLKRGGHLLESPNAYTPGDGSVAENTMAAYQAIQEGRTKSSAGVYYDHREAPAETEMFDDESVLRGLAIAYGDSADIPFCAIHNPPCESPGWVDLQVLADSLQQADTDLQVARADWFNQITHASDAWISSTAWRARFDGSKSVADREMVVLGFDGSRGRAKGKPDATALIGCRVNDGHVFTIGVWEAGDHPNTWATWEPNIVEIEAAIGTAFLQYNVVAFYADPGKDWRSHINAWEAKWGQKVQIKAGPNHPFEWWMTGGRSGLVERAIEQLEGAILNGDMTHDGSSTLTRHVLNARRRFSHSKLALGKENDYSSNKIDACVAAVLAYQARLDALSRVVSEPSSFYMPRKLY